MLLIKNLHVALAFITMAGFVVRGLLALAEAPLHAKWVRIAPHVIDTLLLACGITLAVQLSLSPLSNDWLMAKIIGIVVYIGFGVMTMRARTFALRRVGFVGAVVTIGYIFWVAYSKQVLPF